MAFSTKALLLMFCGCINSFVVDAAYYSSSSNYYGYSDSSSSSSSSSSSNSHFTEQEVDLSSVDFDGLSIMPVSCIEYMNGHMIKYELFDASNNFQCHANKLGTFVVSISHYMRAYFNYQALLQGQDFKLPSDAGYLNCVMLQQTAYSDVKLYAKIGCQERDTYTSTKLKVHVYTDKQCSEPYTGSSSSVSSAKGYDINGYYFSSKVSFRPPFYSCMSCKPNSIASSFSKRKTYWYDDDAAANGQDIYKYFDDWLDDYFVYDDAYFKVQQYVGHTQTNKRDDDDDFYTVDDRRSRNLVGSRIQNEIRATEGALELYEKEFWDEHEEIRGLGNGNTNSYNDDNVRTWNICSKAYNYGIWCDSECRALDAFRIDKWSKSDLFLLIVMLVFMSFMMLLIIAKRVKAYEKASIYGDYTGLGLSPTILSICSGVIFLIVIVLAALKFVNETLVFAVVICILLFILMLKQTLFETNRPTGLLEKRKKRRDPYRYAGDYDGDNPLFT